MPLAAAGGATGAERPAHWQALPARLQFHPVPPCSLLSSHAGLDF